MSNADRPEDGEFDIIKRFFGPLAAKEPGALDLRDDAAVLPMKSGYDLVMTMDTVISGVHFLDNDPPESVATKALAVNLSDLAAMGAEPFCYTLALSLNKDTSLDWIGAFASTLQSEQEKHAIALVGGDTTRTPGPTMVTIAANGFVPTGKAIKRSGANIGDAIYVSGTIGEGALGLMALQGALPLGVDPAVVDRCIAKYRFPQPRLKLGRTMREIATAAIDVSDGLLQDLGHICDTSGVGATLEIGSIPLAIKDNIDLAPRVLNGGDDYEIVFTTGLKEDSSVQSILQDCGIACRRIGTVVEGRGVMVYDKGIALDTIAENGGYNHFS